jgi:hypothetical protein
MFTGFMGRADCIGGAAVKQRSIPMQPIAPFQQLRILVLLFCALASLPRLAYANPIAIAAAPMNFGLGSGGPGVQPDLVGSFFLEVATAPGKSVRLFEVPVTSADVGTTFHVTAATDSDFNDAAASLTNGIDAFHGYGLQFADGFWGTQSVTEGELFHNNLDFPSPNPDLQGFRLTRISARLDTLHVSATPTTRDVSFTGVLSFDGSPSSPVPEPSTLVLVGMPVALAASRRIWRAALPRHG